MRPTPLFFAYAKTTSGVFELSITILNRLAQSKDGPVNLLHLAQKRSRNPLVRAFGRRLAELRGDRSRQQISNRLEGLGARLDASSLFQYEAGTVWAPDVGVLRGLAEIYGVPLEELVVLLLSNRKRTDAKPEEWRDLLRHEPEYKSASQQRGGTVDPASDRIQQERLERERAASQKRNEEAAEEIHAVIARLTTVAASLVEAGTHKRKKTGGGRRDRKAG